MLDDGHEVRVKGKRGMEMLDGRLWSRVVNAGRRPSWRKEKGRKGEFGDRESKVVKKNMCVESHDQCLWKVRLGWKGEGASQ